MTVSRSVGWLVGWSVAWLDGRLSSVWLVVGRACGHWVIQLVGQSGIQLPGYVGQIYLSHIS